MRTHAESIWIDSDDVANIRDCSDLCDATADEEQSRETDVEFVPAAAYLALKEKLDAANTELESLRTKSSTNKGDGDYYIVDTRGTVGNCASFWAIGGNGYCCGLDEAGLFPKNYSDRETDVQVPREIVESAIVKHVRVDAIRAEMKRRGLKFKGGRI